MTFNNEKKNCKSKRFEKIFDTVLCRYYYQCVMCGHQTWTKPEICDELCSEVDDEE